MRKLYPIIQKDFSIFSRRCIFCNKLFRFKGFKIQEYNKFVNRLFFSYCCHKCSNSEEEVLNKINKINKMGEDNYEI